MGVILTAAYMLWLYRRVVFGKIVSAEIKTMPDLKKIEIYILGSLVLLTLFFGIYPDPLLSTVDISISNLIENYQTDIKIHLAQAKN